MPAIVRLLADDGVGRRREDQVVPLRGEYWSAYEAIDRDPNNQLVVVEDAAEILGTIQVTFIPYMTFVGGWRANIEAVRTASWRCDDGVVRLLVGWVLDEARRRGCHLAQLAVDLESSEARAFYETLGFTVTEAGMKRYLVGDAEGR